METVGPNAVPLKHTGLPARLLRKLWAPVPWMLEATIVLESVLGKWLDALIILAVLSLNTALGIIQERRAEAAVDLLRTRLEINARALRDGAWTMIPASRLVPGDAIHLRVGDFVPADVVVHDGTVMVDQSTLTGESMPVARGPESTVYSGATVMRGEASGTVTATGAATYFGKTAELVGSSAPAAHLEHVVLRIVRVFIAVDLVLAVAGTAGLAAAGSTTADVISYAVILLLASVPVAMPAAFALAGALGARHLASLGILTTRLTALQDAASMSVLCIDKTGTLTENRLAVAAVAPIGDVSRDELLRWAAAASDAATQDPLDLAILAAAGESAGAGDRLSFTPFDPATKRSEATVSRDGRTVRVAKGAPHVIAAMAEAAPPADLAALAAGGARVLAVAVNDGTWRLLGLIALADRVRPEAAGLLARLTGLGIRVIMVTGDSAGTAAAVAADVGLTGGVVQADDLAALTGGEGGPSVIAQVLPQDKHRIVQLLQQAGHVVGMTGDGVNDAPALRQAEVGIAMETATDVAKSAAGVVLVRGGLNDIVGLVEESRRIHQRSLTYALNVSVKKLEVPLLLTAGVFSFGQLVFTPLLMALLLLANDVVSMMLTTDNARSSQRPDTWHVGRTIAGALVVAVPMLGSSLALLWASGQLWPGGGIDQSAPLSS
ncbi:HAD-IC family P-type ATPase [Pseudarthrobacter sp. J1763]|uniref:HAD-IC family P-type ATPase n=1 Tax=Pseudarthrobacter sp. J1763 TaxID=3420445 RepID=UPI003D27091D